MKLTYKDKGILKNKISKFVFDNFSIYTSDWDYDYEEETIVYCSDRIVSGFDNSLNDIVEDIYEAIVK